MVAIQRITNIWELLSGGHCFVVENLVTRTSSSVNPSKTPTTLVAQPRSKFKSWPIATCFYHHLSRMAAIWGRLTNEPLFRWPRGQCEPDLRRNNKNNRFSPQCVCVLVWLSGLSNKLRSDNHKQSLTHSIGRNLIKGCWHAEKFVKPRIASKCCNILPAINVSLLLFAQLYLTRVVSCGVCSLWL